MTDITMTNNKINDALEKEKRNLADYQKMIYKNGKQIPNLSSEYISQKERKISECEVKISRLKHIFTITNIELRNLLFCNYNYSPNYLDQGACIRIEFPNKTKVYGSVRILFEECWGNQFVFLSDTTIVTIAIDKVMAIEIDYDRGCCYDYQKTENSISESINKLTEILSEGLNEFIYNQQ